MVEFNLETEWTVYMEFYLSFTDEHIIGRIRDRLNAVVGNLMFCRIVITILFGYSWIHSSKSIEL